VYNGMELSQPRALVGATTIPEQMAATRLRFHASRQRPESMGQEGYCLLDPDGTQQIYWSRCQRARLATTAWNTVMRRMAEILMTVSGAHSPDSLLLRYKHICVILSLR
jgi:hypothetical protein